MPASHHGEEGARDPRLREGRSVSTADTPPRGESSSTMAAHCCPLVLVDTSSATLDGSRGPRAWPAPDHPSLDHHRISGEPRGCPPHVSDKGPEELLLQHGHSHRRTPSVNGGEKPRCTRPRGWETQALTLPDPPTLPSRDGRLRSPRTPTCGVRPRPPRLTPWPPRRAQEGRPQGWGSQPAKLFEPPPCSGTPSRGRPRPPPPAPRRPPSAQARARLGRRVADCLALY